jgi:hypothetical protein
MDRPLVTRQGVDAAYVIPDNVSRLGAAVIVLIKLQAVPLAGASLSSRPSLCALRFSFVSCSFPRVGRRPDLDGFHMLSTDHPQLSLRLYHGIGLSVLETSNLLRYLAARLCRSLQPVCDGPAGVDEWSLSSAPSRRPVTSICSHGRPLEGQRNKVWKVVSGMQVGIVTLNRSPVLTCRRYEVFESADVGNEVVVCYWVWRCRWLRQDVFEYFRRRGNLSHFRQPSSRRTLHLPVLQAEESM